MCNELVKLREYLRELPTGKVGDIDALQGLLAAAWDELEGGDEESMAGYKLSDRMEEVEWTPPTLSFRIARHGGTAMGSTREEIHHWSVDVQSGKATCSPSGCRQVKPRRPPLDVEPIAREIRDKIIAGADDERLKWGPKKEWVRVNLKACVSEPGEKLFSQTLSGRRRRLGDALIKMMDKEGWPRRGNRGAAFGRPS